jgi:8-amino-7-oxononanoate synthase
MQVREPSALPHQLEARLLSRLARQQQKSRKRKLSLPNGIDFASNDYLGLADHPAIRQNLIEALNSDLPLGSGGSRLLRGNTTWHEAFEAELAEWKGSEAALIFNSGYAANVGLIGTLARPGDLILSDALIHASMIDGIRESKADWISFRHNDADHLAQLLAEHSESQRQIWILVESLYSMDGDRAPLPAYFELAQRFNAALIIDEAHATGLYGPEGQGLIYHHQLDANAVIAVHTCGKAWGASGAFITCPALIKDYLINQCRGFIYSTAPSPLQIVQWRSAKHIATQEPQRREQAHAMAQHFRECLGSDLDLGQSDSHIVPVIIGDDQRTLEIAKQLQDQGFDIRAIRPPSVPRGTARLRISFNAKHTLDEVDTLIQCLRNLFQFSL